MGFLYLWICLLWTLAGADRGLWLDGGLDLDGTELSNVQHHSLLYFRCNSCKGEQVDFIAWLIFDSAVLLLFGSSYCVLVALPLLIELIDNLTNF